MTRRDALLFVLLAILAAVRAGSASAAAPSAADLEFFETRIRPVLVEQCYRCHNATDKAEGALALDDRAGLLKGGDGGPIIVPGNPAESRLLPILRHEVPDLKMPAEGQRLDAGVIADFEKWIVRGAPDPRDRPPTAAELAKATSWETQFEKRKAWWSFQPIRPAAPPDSPAARNWSDHPVDRFIFAGLQDHGLEPGPRADAQTLVRRAFFALTGLPPTPEEVEHWTPRAAQPQGFAALVDHLLASPQFGERWARHWMDWIRYADSHGSEGDPLIEGGWRYRDYLIRALNADVSFDQLVREHIAGDLLEQPRINPQLGINESLIGPAHWRMVFHGFSPTDALEEKVRFVDDQINAFSKGFLGLTVSCARCHDHKFDAISQRDYYALFGILGSCRPGRVAIDVPEKLNAHRDELAALKPRIRAAVAADWSAQLPTVRERLLADDGPATKADAPAFALHPWHLLQQDLAKGMGFAEAWQRRVAAWQHDRQQRRELADRQVARRWDLSSAAEYAAWFRTGNGLPGSPSPPGEFAVAATGDTALTGIYPAGVYSHALSAKHAARLTSGYARLDGDYELWVRAVGDAGATARYVVQHYPRNGVIFPLAPLKPDWRWHRLDLSYWNGDEFHLELTTAGDAPLLAKDEPRSWFGVREAVLQKKGEAPPPDTHEFLDPWFELAAAAPPQNRAAAADRLVAAVAAAITAWQAGTASDAQAELLNACLRQDVLPNQRTQLATAAPLLAEYRRLEEAIVVPTRVPGVEETVARDQALFQRGNHKQAGEVVPRRFLSAINPAPYQTTLSGRRELAADVLRSDNPLTRRVIVNRLWHHLFGRGIVATPDNLGHLGQRPTHPELLDYLATRFAEHGGSLKESIRFLMTSETWQLTSRPTEKARQEDPDNQFLSHAHLRRLEAEAIRDSLLAVSGSLDRELFGPPVDGGSPRRSIYVLVRRNALDPLLRAFDFPEPFTTVGRRDVTNVPAQSLTLMNDPRVAMLARQWAGRILTDREPAADEQVRGMFLAALGRPAQPHEISRFQAYLVALQDQQRETARQVAALRQQINEQQAALDKLLAPARERLQAGAAKPRSDDAAAVQPIGRWDFQDDLRDAVAAAHGKAHGGARVDGGALVVGHGGYVVTAPLEQALTAKTLEAWVQLDDLNQRGGGVMTIQSKNGAVFDAIVFAEKRPGEWLAGSNFFQRTQPFNGPAEADAASRPVHIAIAWHLGGQIACYRDGEQYGTTYQATGPIEFKAGEAVVSFGLRHLPAGGNKLLAGRILRARLYDRALSAEEVRASFSSGPQTISTGQVLAALSAADRQQVAAGQQRIAALEAQIAALGSAAAPPDEQALWTDAARAIFTFQEFIFVK